MLPHIGRSAKILQEGSCERRRSAGTSPGTLVPRPRGYARGVSMAGGGGRRFRFLPWGRLRLDGVALRARPEATRRGTASRNQSGATTSSRGDPCWGGVWLGGCQGVLKLHLRHVGAAGGIPRRRRRALVPPPPSVSIRGAACDRVRTRGGAGGSQTYERAATTLAAGGPASGGRFAGGSHTWHTPRAVGVHRRSRKGWAVRCLQNDFTSRVAYGSPPRDAANA